MRNIGNMFERKTRQIGRACRIMNRASAAIGWIEIHAPQWLSGLLYRVYWRVDDWASDRFSRAYPGSIEEIRDAWEHQDEDWLSPFQRKVADGRILPL